jgi:alanine racemase
MLELGPPGSGAGGQATVLLAGRRCPVVGLVTMDLTMVETGDAAVQVGDVATVVGEGTGGERITLEEYAAASGELQREVLTGLGPRLPRIYP